MNSLHLVWISICMMVLGTLIPLAVFHIFPNIFSNIVGFIATIIASLCFISYFALINLYAWKQFFDRIQERIDNG
jgi:hypothetical protein